MEGHRTARRAVGLAVLLGVLAAVPAAAQAPPAPDMAQIADRASRSVVAVFAQRTETPARPRPGRTAPRLHTRAGSGVAVDESFVLTTASVVLDAEHVFVRTSNGLQAEARIQGVDLVFNLALLSVPDLRLPWIHPAQQPPQLGDRMIAIGTSFGQRPTQSVGTIEYVYREPRNALLQLTNVVQPGNSGGAALNVRGELAGIIQGELGAPELPGGENDHRPSGMSFMMPVQYVWPVYESLRRTGRVPHGYMGVGTRAEIVVSDVDKAEIGLGARVEKVQPDGPAARVGLRRGDLIVGFENERVEFPEQLARWVAETPPGTPVDLVWVRGELRRTGRAVLAESRDSLPSWALGGAARRLAAPPTVSPVSNEDRR